MSTLADLAGPLGAALDAARLRACRVLAAELPGDVIMSSSEGGIALTGRALSLRAATDPRLRDFAGLVKAAS